MSLESDHLRRERSAENLYQHAREALRGGERERARQLLLQAVEYDRDHSDAWLWLSATTDDPQEQKIYLEWAIAANPANAAAKRGLGLLTGQIKAADLAPAAGAPQPEAAQAPAPAEVERTFTCPQCGGALRYEPGTGGLRCAHCGYAEPVAAVALAGGEQVLDFALPTVQSQRWAVGERLVKCAQCGASTVAPPGQKSEQCPFCGAAALIAAAEEAELLPPQGLIPMGYDAAGAEAAMTAWLKGGWLMPDDLAQLARNRRLQPVYVPFWCFNASVSARWRARVAEGSGRTRRWVPRTGERTFFFTDFLQPGTGSLPEKLLRQADPFDLKKLVAYSPSFLAGWPAGTYDVSLAQASLQAREGMLDQARRQLFVKAALGQDVTDLQITGSDFTGQTYRLVLLPLWVGAYSYRKVPYRVLVNGQTGKVAGDRPVDWVKVWLIVLAVAALLAPVVIWVVLRLLRP